MSNAMWGGRFAAGPAEIMEEINASIDFDRKLAAQDIAGSQAHVAMLARQGVVDAADAEAIAKGLAQVKGEIEAGTLHLLARARRHPYECREPARRDRRPGRRPAAHRALAQRPGRARFPPLGARRDRRARSARSRRCSGRSRRARSNAPAWSCRASPICSRPSRSPSAIICMAYVEMLARDAGPLRATRASASTNARSARRRSPAPPSRSTAR